MYPLIDEVKELFKANYRQTVTIDVFGTKTSFQLTENDTVQGSFEIERHCISGEKIEIGTACASELIFKLNNSDGKYDDVKFEGAELYVRLGIKKWDAYNWENAQMHYIPLGYFTVDAPPRKLSTITIQALDRMMQFDKAYDSTLTYPATIKAIIEDACANCNIPLQTDLTTLINNDYIVLVSPKDGEITYRQAIQWAAELTGACAYIDCDGKLRFEWYTTSGVTITKEDRYSSDIYEDSVIITGVQIADEDNVKYLSGTTDYALAISDNGLAQSDYQTLADNLNAVLSGFTYVPFSAKIKPSPYLFPLDTIIFTDKNGVDHSTVITHTLFKLNANTSIYGKGETATRNGWAAANPLTKRQSAVIKAMQNKTNEALNTRIQTILEFNELICQSMGVYSTNMTLGDGSIKHYMHDKPKLEDSLVIYTITADGFAWTNAGWQNGSPTWQYGFDKDGNAIFKAISAYGISVSQPSTDHSVKITPDTIAFMYRLTEIMKLSGEKAEMTKVNVNNELNVGNARFVPATGGMNIVIID